MGGCCQSESKSNHKKLPVLGHVSSWYEYPFDETKKGIEINFVDYNILADGLAGVS